MSSAHQRFACQIESPLLLRICLTVKPRFCHFRKNSNGEQSKIDCFCKITDLLLFFPLFLRFPRKHQHEFHLFQTLIFSTTNSAIFQSFASSIIPKFFKEHYPGPSQNLPPSMVNGSDLFRKKLISTAMNANRKGDPKSLRREISETTKFIFLKS